MELEIKFVNKSTNPNPCFADKGSSGFDLRAWITEENGGEYNGNKCFTILSPLERKLIHTGLYFDLPYDKEIQVRPRSGLALKHGISVLNTPGTVDASYTGELCVILINLSNLDFEITNGDKIAQGVLCDALNGYKVELVQIEEITKKTERGDGGFGHSGI
jgi:dUTP pyrophosphatase